MVSESFSGTVPTALTLVLAKREEGRVLLGLKLWEKGGRERNARGGVSWSWRSDISLMTSKVVAEDVCFAWNLSSVE